VAKAATADNGRRAAEREAGEARAAAAAAAALAESARREQEEAVGRGLHSFTSQLNLNRF
jgi:hypothetical protein